MEALTNDAITSAPVAAHPRDSDDVKVFVWKEPSLSLDDGHDTMLVIHHLIVKAYREPNGTGMNILVNFDVRFYGWRMPLHDFQLISYTKEGGEIERFNLGTGTSEIDPCMQGQNQHTEFFNYLYKFRDYFAILDSMAIHHPGGTYAWCRN